MFGQILRAPSRLDFSLKYNSSFALGLGGLVAVSVFLLIWPEEQIPDKGNKLIDSLICGFVAILVFGGNLSVLPQILPDFFREDKWTIGRDVIFTAWVFFAVGIVNSLMLRYLGWVDFRWLPFISQQLLILVLGLPPVTALVLLRNQSIKKKNSIIAKGYNQLLLQAPRSPLMLQAAGKRLLLNAAEPLDQKAASSSTKEVPQLPKINLQAETGEWIEIDPLQLSVIHSEKGILHLYWLEENGGIEYRSLKIQLKKVEQLFDKKYGFLLRCHRFFWVNALQIEKMEANARGLQIKMQAIPQLIPVSKTYTEELKTYLKNS